MVPSASDPVKWHVLRLRPSAELAVAGSLKNRLIPVFVPFYTSQRQWSGRSKDIQLPLFPGYAFCVPPPSAHDEVLAIPGVAGFVRQGASPATVDDAELRPIRRMLDSGFPVQPWPFVNEGQKARVVKGLLAGTVGILVRRRTLVVSVGLLQHSVAVELDEETSVAAIAAI